MKPNFTSSTDFLEKFWSLLEIKGENDCWLWKGKVVRSSQCLYGRYTDRHNSILMHQTSFMLAYGNLNPNLDVMHSCDESLCGNPKHLSQGTRTQNQEGAYQRNRRTNKGLDNPKAKLTEQEAISIYYIYKYSNVTAQKIANLYHLGNTTLSQIINKKHWATKNLQDVA